MSRDTFNFRYFTTNLRLFIVLLAMMALPMGCAKVQPEPFTQFESITGQGSILVAAIVKRDTANLRKMYIARQANNPNFNTDSLKLHYSGNFILV